MTFNKSLHGSANRNSQATRVLTSNLRENIEMIKKATGNSPDIIIRELRFEGEYTLEAALIYASGLADIKFINQFIMEPLMSSQNERPLTADRFPQAAPLDFFKNKLLSVGEIQDGASADTLLNGILSGDTAILCQGSDHGLLIASKGWEERGVQEPTSQTVIRGPKEGFAENIATNIALIRRKIKDPNLWLEHFHVGRITKTTVSIMYINGIAMENVIKEVRDRIEGIQIDGILESGYIEELIQDKGFTPAPLVASGDRDS